MKIKNITLKEVNEVQKQMQAEGKHSDTINGSLSLVKRLLENARKEGILVRNPCEIWQKLKKTEEDARNTYHRALTREEQRKFFDSYLSKKNSRYNFYRMAVLTGMRYGEIAALQYNDIKSGFIYIKRTVTTTEEGRFIVGDDTKTIAGTRKIPLTDDIKKVIQAQKEQNAIFGFDVISMNDRIFITENGTIPHISNLNGSLKKICRQLDIEPFSLHAFRATFATRCVESKMDPKTLQEILGHKKISMTMDLYAHATDETKTEAMELVKNYAG